MAGEEAYTKEDNSNNVALVFGVTGLVGKEIAKSLLKTSRWKVYGVARKPDEFPIQDSNYHFISCDLLNQSQTMEKLSSLQDVTHVYWVTWASQFQLDTQECCDQNREMMSNALNAILPRARNLNHFSLQTGTKHYVSLSSDVSNEKRARCYSEETPRVVEGHNFYYGLEDLLKEKLQGKVAWSVQRPGLILGSSKRTLYNVMGCISVYAAICKHLQLPFVFGGTKECWEEVYLDGSDARLVAEQHIWASTKHSLSSTEGRAYNSVNGTHFTWKEIWPALGNKFGVEVPENMFSTSFSFVEFMADKGHVWDEIVRKEGLEETKIEDLANWWFLDSLFRCPVKMLASRNKANRLGFRTTYKTLDSILYWTECMREARWIP
ncbi:Delta(4)-3-oxosteroid 5beta-reductase [Ranunculus cassubicifolius]